MNLSTFYSKFKSNIIFKLLCFKQDEEWNDFKEEVKDYSDLRIQNLQIVYANIKFENFIFLLNHF